MKKDKKFLMDLEKNLVGIKDKYKKDILIKYENIIKAQKADNKKITVILKELGPVTDIANKEIEALGSKAKLTVLDNLKNKVEDYNEKRQIEKEVKSRLKDEKEAAKRLNDKNIKVSVNNKKVKSDKESTKKAKEKEESRKKKLEEKVKKERKEAKEKELKLKKKEEEIELKAKEKEEEKKAIEIEIKAKEDEIKAKEEEKIVIEKEVKKAEKILKKEENDLNELIELKEEIKEEIKDEPKKEKIDYKEKFHKFKDFLVKDRSFERKRKVTDSPKEVVEEVKEEFKEEIADVSEIVADKHIFESRKSRLKRIILRTLGVLVTAVVLFAWLWVCVVFIASIIAYLDGVKFIGIILGLFGLSLLMLWIVIMVNRALFAKKMSLKVNLIVVILSIVIIALGIVLTLKQISEIKTVKDVSVKYSMTTKMNNYDLPEDKTKPFTLTFNSNYNTQYTINYDERIKDKVKVEVKYYECYYDYFIKQTSNSAYMSLKLDNRDRLSVYIDDLKEGLVFDNDELSRYSVKITINKDDINRLVILD